MPGCYSTGTSHVNFVQRPDSSRPSIQNGPSHNAALRDVCNVTHQILKDKMHHKKPVSVVAGAINGLLATPQAPILGAMAGALNGSQHY